MTYRSQTLIELQMKQADAARRMAPAWRATFAALAEMQSACAKRIGELLKLVPRQDLNRDCGSDNRKRGTNVHGELTDPSKK